jgi:hypothetical protein
MGVYVNTFRTDHKVVEINGQRVKVYAYRYLCRHGDEDPWRSTRRSRLLQASIEGSAQRFAEHKPTFAGLVHENDWTNTVVYSNPKGGVWYDTEAFPGEAIVGFLIRKGRGWTLQTERRGEDFPFAAGYKFTRRYTQRVVAGDIQRTNDVYICQANNVEMTEAQFLEWKAKAEPEYLAACQKLADDRKREEEQVAAARQARLTAKDTEIADATRRLQELQIQRAAI